MTAEPITRQETRFPNPAGFNLVEVGVALAIVAFALIVVVQLGYWSMQERARTASRFVAIELAANVLEAARTVPWESLGEQWSIAQQIPESLNQQLPEGTLTVRVEAIESQPGTKRVTVEVRWVLFQEIAAHPVQLVGLFARRSVEREGDEK